VTDGQPKQGDIPSERIEELAEQITREVCKILCIPFWIIDEIKKAERRLTTKMTFKKMNGKFFVTVNGHTEEFKKLSTALLFIKIASGRI
jgi:hypothetical protein